MFDYLVLRWDAAQHSGTDRAQWLGVTRDGQITTAGEGNLADAVVSYEGCDPPPAVVLLAPADAVLLSAIELPPEQERHLKQVLPFLVEEKLVDDIEDVHIGVGPRRRGQQLAVAVLRHVHIINWLDALYSAGLPPAWVVPESLALPWQPGQVSVLVGRESCLIRDGQWHGMACDPDNLVLALTTLCRNSGGDTLTVQLLHEADLVSTSLADTAIRQLQQLTDDTGQVLDVDIRMRASEKPVTELLATQLASELPQSFNLLQGGYAVDRGGAAGTFSLRRVGLAFAACLLVHLGLTLAAGIWFSSQAQESRENAVAVYREWFPETRRVFEPRRQLRSELSRLGGDDRDQLMTYIRALATSGPWQGAQLQTLSFDGARASMTMEWEADSAEVLVQLREQLARSGLQSELGPITPSASGGVGGQLDVSGVL